MHGITLIALIALLPIAAPAIAQQSPAVVQQSPAVAVELRCEYLTNPVGIDAIAPRLSWRMHDARRGAKQAAYQVLVAGSPEVLAEDRGDLWDSGKVDSAQSIGVAYGGKRLSSATRAYWKVRLWDADGNPSAYSEPARWEMALLSQDDWRAKWICSPKPLPTRDKDFYKVHPAPLFRKSFSAAKPIRRATVHVSGLGYYELSINGRRVGDRVLDPAWTTYSKRVLYSTFDVTDMLAQGENVLAAVVGNGWYNPLPMRMWGRRNLREALTIGRPRLILQLNLEYADGSRESVVTDETWKTADGPILKNSIYLGELYDARREQSSWRKPAFDQSDWQAAVASTEPLGPLRAQAVQPIMVTRKIKAVRLTEPKPGVFVFDLGQNFTGWARLRVSGKAGAAVTMTMGELLFDDGLVNARTAATGQIKRPGVGGPGAPDQALQKNTYVLKGSGEEVYTPRFTFHGFRYVQVEGFPGKATLDAIEGLRTNSAVAPAGSFQCSNERFNRIYGLFDWTLLSNLQGVQSDCPHREKFGYGGDIVACDEAVILGFDMAAVYAKTIEDFNDAARDNGGFTETAPFVGIRGGLGEGAGPVGWGTAHPLLQWHLLQYYGNRRILEQQYEATKRWLNLLQKNAKDHILNEGIGDHESLARAPRPLTGTAFYYYNIRLGQRIAAVLGHRDDAERYGRLADDIRDALNNKFLDKTSGTYGPLTQAAQAFALFMNLVPKNQKAAALNVLVDDVMKQREGHLSTGIFGTNYMLHVLSNAGRDDVAFTIVNQKTFPGWGYMLENGATTLWEHWDYSDNTFSHNHPMFGSVNTWLIKSIVGIRPSPDALGFDKIIIQPRVVGDLTWAKGSYRSVRGEVKSEWRVRGGKFHLDVTIPANTTATVHIPLDKGTRISESGRPATDSKGLRLLETGKDEAIFSAQAGSYHFIVQ